MTSAHDASLQLQEVLKKMEEQQEQLNKLQDESKARDKTREEDFKAERSRADSLQRELQQTKDRLRDAEQKGTGGFDHEAAAMAKQIARAKPYRNVVMVKNSDVAKAKTAWEKDNSARVRMEKQAVSDMCRMSTEGKIEPMVATMAYYLTDDASPAERTLMLQWVTSSSPGRVQLEHQALMLSKRADYDSLLDDTAGHILAAPFPLFHSPHDIEAVRVLNQKVKDLRVHDVVGGGPVGALTDQSACGGFGESPWAREVSGGGSLPVIEIADGKLATDTTFLEAHLEEMRKGFAEALQTLRKSVADLQEQKLDTSTPEDIRQLVKKAVDRCSKKMELFIDDRVFEIEQRVDQRRRSGQYQRQPNRNQYAGHAQRRPLSGFQ